MASKQTEASKPLVIERTITAPISRVWRAFTDEQELNQWSPYIPAFKAEVGFKFQFFLGPSPENQYLHVCQVTEVAASSKLAYSWRYDGYPGNSLLTYEFFAEGDKTRLKLTWAGLETFPSEFTREGFSSGSSHTLQALQEFVEK